MTKPLAPPHVVPSDAADPTPTRPYRHERGVSLETRAFGSVLVAMSFSLLAWLTIHANDVLGIAGT